MGIDGLYKFISKNFPDIYNSVCITDIAGKSCIIDGMQHIYGQLIYMRSRDKEIITPDGKNISHIHGLINSLTYYLKHGIIPIFVFDGKSPDIKRKKIEERRKTLKDNLSKLKELENKKKDLVNMINSITLNNVKNDITNLQSEQDQNVELEQSLLENSSSSEGENSNSDDESSEDDLVFGTPPTEIINIEEEMIKMNNISEEYKKIYKKAIIMKDYYIRDWIEILELLGLPVIKAKGEADPLCAYLLKNNRDLFGIISDDSDMLAFGAPILMRKSHNQHFTIIELKKLIDKIEMALSIEFGKYTKFTINDLVEFSILLGTDYGTFKLNYQYADTMNLLKYYVREGRDYKKLIQESDYEYFETIKKYYTEQNFQEQYTEYLTKPTWKKPKFMELKKILLDLSVDEDYIDKNNKFLDYCYNKIEKNKARYINTQQFNPQQFNPQQLYQCGSLPSNSNISMFENIQIRRKRSNSLDSIESNIKNDVQAIINENVKKDFDDDELDELKNLNNTNSSNDIKTNTKRNNRFKRLEKNPTFYTEKISFYENKSKNKNKYHYSKKYNKNISPSSQSPRNSQDSQNSSDNDFEGSHLRSPNIKNEEIFYFES